MPASERTTGISRLFSSPTSPSASDLRPWRRKRISRASSSSSRLDAGEQVEDDARRLLALQRDGGGAAQLQDRRPRDAVVGEQELPRLAAQHLVAAAHLAPALEADPLQLAQEVGAQAQRDQRRHRLHQAVAQRGRQALPRAVAAELRAGPAAAGQDQAPGRKLAPGGQRQGEAVLGGGDPLDLVARAHVDLEPLQFPAQDVQYRRRLPRAGIDPRPPPRTTQAMPSSSKKLDGAGRREAGQHRGDEGAVAAVEPGEGAVGVGEVAAAVAGGQQLLADAVLALEQHDLGAVAGGADGGHHPRAAAADHRDPERVRSSLPRSSLAEEMVDHLAFPGAGRGRWRRLAVMKDLASATATRKPRPRASQAVMAAEKVQPEPWLLTLRTSGAWKYFPPRSSSSRSTALAAAYGGSRQVPSLHEERHAVSARKAVRRPRGGLRGSAIAPLQRNSASGTLGVTRAAIGKSRSQRTRMARGLISRLPEVAANTGSTTIGMRGIVLEHVGHDLDDARG